MVAKRKAASTLLEQAEEVEQRAQSSKVQQATTDEPSEEINERKQQEVEKSEVAKRTKELKTMAVDKVKDLATSKGLDISNKQEMIDGILKQEAKARTLARAHEAKVREVVTHKKEEFEALSVSDLAKLCQAIGVKGIMGKQGRVECLLKHWQEGNGVDQALKQNAYRERKAELESMGSAALQSLCAHAGVDPFVAEVMVDRIVKMEHDMGRFFKPTPLEKPQVQKQEAKVDMVTALLDSEKNRKKEEELTVKREEALKAKIKELHGMGVQALKDALAKHSVEATGKKDDMVRALFEILAQDEKVKERKSELKGMGQQALKELVSSMGLKTGSLGEMVTAVLAHESKMREKIAAHDAKAAEVMDQKKQELNGKTNQELKELCASKGLKLGITKEERIERLVEEAQRDGEVDALVARLARKARRDALLALPKPELVKICEEVQADPLTREAMVERILEHEREFGLVEQPRAKRARSSKK